MDDATKEFFCLNFQTQNHRPPKFKHKHQRIKTKNRYLANKNFIWTYLSFSTGQGNSRKPEWAQDANEEKPWNPINPVAINGGFDDGRWNPDKYDDGQWKPNGNQRPDENGKYPQFVQKLKLYMKLHLNSYLKKIPIRYTPFLLCCILAVKKVFSKTNKIDSSKICRLLNMSGTKISLGIFW